MSAPGPAVALDGVAVDFGGFAALAGIDLRVAAGERVALVGPSGAGKSTLLGLMNGTVRPTAGRVRVLGQDLARLSPRALRRVQRRVGTIHQHFDLVEPLAVVHNVNAGHLGRWGLARALASLVRPRDVALARAALDRVGIGDKLYATTRTLSGGEKQRVALSRVLVQRADVILADEPIASLDPERGREIMDLLRQVADDSGAALVVSLHNVAFARSHVDRVVGLRRGRVAFDLPAADLTDARLEDLYWIDPRPRA